MFVILTLHALISQCGDNIEILPKLGMMWHNMNTIMIG